MTVFENTMEVLRTRVQFADELCPLLVSSVGSFILNEHCHKMLETEQTVFVRMNLPEDVRTNICIVAPPGYSKSWLFKQFLNPKFGISPLKMKFMGKITEANFSGTSLKGEEVRGMAWVYRDGILCYNEMSNLFLSGEHEQGLVNQVNEALTENHVNKGLALNDISYPTRVGVWGGIQNDRLHDISSGAGRRFIYNTKDWTEDDIELLMDARDPEYQEKHGQVDFENPKRIKDSISALKDQVSNINHAEISKELRKFIRGLSKNHLDMAQYEKVVLGIATINFEGGTELEARCTEWMKNFLCSLEQMQETVLIGNTSLLVKNTPEEGKTVMQLFSTMRKFSYNSDKFYEILGKALKYGHIRTARNEAGELVYKPRLRRKKHESN